MKIVQKDNFDRDNYADVLIATNVNEIYGKRIVDFLNSKYGGPNSEAFYDLVDDDYKLYNGLVY